jgi:hypothetical protein
MRALVLMLAVGFLAAACGQEAAEQAPSLQKKGFYQGKRDTALSDAQVAALQTRAQLQNDPESPALAAPTQAPGVKSGR